MDKRFQVFISSTFADLKEERQAVLRSVLEIDHMPAGMELFPAADATAWQIITDVIDASDYYILVIGGRYGSLDETGIGYTEKEYDYAVAAKKPVIPFLHESPDNLPRDKTEVDSAAWEKLKSFREKVERRHTCVYWRTADDLKARVIVGLTAAIKRIPAAGWVRADKVPTEATVTEILQLRQKILELEGQLQQGRVSPPPGVDDLFQGTDQHEVTLSFKARKPIKEYPFNDDISYTGTIHPTWDDMFAAVGPSMINEVADEALKQSLKNFLYSQGREAWKELNVVADRSLINFSVSDETVETIVVQFRALGLIRESVKARSVKDTRTFWALTAYGDQLMTQLRALRRVSNAPKTLPSSVTTDAPTSRRAAAKKSSGKRRSSKA